VTTLSWFEEVHGMPRCGLSFTSTIDDQASLFNVTHITDGCWGHHLHSPSERFCLGRM
jgi:hypothetical protein